MKKRLSTSLSLLLALILLVSGIPFAFAADPVHIASVDDFTAFVAGDAAADAVLDADIDLGEWTTAFTDGYSGTFDGNGHSISYTKTNPTGNFHSLIKILNEGGVIKNLTIKGSMTFNAARTYNASFVYENHGTIEGCVNEMSITHTGTKNCQYASGITAKNYGTVKDCVNNAEISVRNYAGGIVAQNMGGTVLNCTNNGNITATNTAGYAGGIVAAIGAANSADVNLIENCVNNSDVTGGSGDYGFAGGIVGQINIASSYATYQSQPSITIKGCSSTGALSAGGGTDEFVAKNNNPDNSTLTIEAGAPAHVHTYDEGEITTHATCATAGVRTYTCTSCDEGTEGHIYTEPIPATGNHTAPDTWTAETIDGNEKLVKRCTVCNQLLAQKSAAAAATLENVLQSLSDNWFRLTPKFGRDTNVCTMLSAAIESYGYEGVAVSVAAAENPADGTAAIADNGDITYFYADPAVYRPMWSASIPVTFTLSLEDADTTYEKNAVINWDADKAKSAMEDNIVSYVTADVMKGDNESLEAVTDALVLPKVALDAENNQILWTLISWTSSDPDAIVISDKNQTSADTLFNPYVGEVKRGIEDKTVTLTATYNFQRTSYDEEPITIEKQYTVTVKGIGDELLQQMQQQLDANYTVDKLTYITDKTPIDPTAVTQDVQLLLPRTSGISNPNDYTFTVTSDNEANASVSSYRLNVTRPLPGEAPAAVTLTVTMKHKNYSDLSVSKQLTLTVAPIAQTEIDAQKALMEQVKAHFFDGINNGANEAPDKVVNNLHAFYEAIPDGNGGLKWIYTNAEVTDLGISAVSIDPFHPSERWDKFQSTEPDVISHENLVVTPAEENTTARIYAMLSSKQFERYAELYPDNEDFDALYRQEVWVDLVVPGTNPTTPDTPDTPDAPDTPAAPDNLCKFCGKDHTGFWGKIVQFFHNIFYFFAHYVFHTK